jgi:hypothetical protein
VNPIVLTERAVEMRQARTDPLIVNILREGVEVSATPQKGASRATSQPPATR